MSLFFNNDALVRTEGTLYLQDAQKLVKESNKYKTNYNVNDNSGDKNRGCAVVIAVVATVTAVVADNGGGDSGSH